MKNKKTKREKCDVKKSVISLGIGLTAECNFRCEHCYSTHLRKKKQV